MMQPHRLKARSSNHSLTVRGNHRLLGDPTHQATGLPVVSDLGELAYSSHLTDLYKTYTIIP